MLPGDLKYRVWRYSRLKALLNRARELAYPNNNCRIIYRDHTKTIQKSLTYKDLTEIPKDYLIDIIINFFEIGLGKELNVNALEFKVDEIDISQNLLSLQKREDFKRRIEEVSNQAQEPIFMLFYIARSLKEEDNIDPFRLSKLTMKSITIAKEAVYGKGYCINSEEILNKILASCKLEGEELYKI
jgi:hypothetical protein